MLKLKDARSQYLIYIKISLKFSTGIMHGVDTPSKWQWSYLLYSTYSNVYFILNFNNLLLFKGKANLGKAWNNEPLTSGTDLEKHILSFKWFITDTIFSSWIQDWLTSECELVISECKAKCSVSGTAGPFSPCCKRISWKTSFQT